MKTNKWFLENCWFQRSPPMLGPSSYRISCKDECYPDQALTVLEFRFSLVLVTLGLYIMKSQHKDAFQDSKNQVPEKRSTEIEGSLQCLVHVRISQLTVNMLLANSL